MAKWRTAIDKYGQLTLKKGVVGRTGVGATYRVRRGPMRGASGTWGGPGSATMLRHFKAMGIVDARAGKIRNLETLNTSWRDHGPKYKGRIRSGTTYNLVTPGRPYGGYKREPKQTSSDSYISVGGRKLHVAAYFAGVRQAQKGRNAGSFAHKSGTWKKGAGGRFVGSGG